MNLPAITHDTRKYAEEWKQRAVDLRERDAILSELADLVAVAQRNFAFRAAQVMKRDGEASL